MTMRNTKETPKEEARGRKGLLVAKPIAVYFSSPEFREKVTKYAKASNVSASSLFTVAVEYYMKRNPINEDSHGRNKEA